MSHLPGARPRQDRRWALVEVIVLVATTPGSPKAPAADHLDAPALTASAWLDADINNLYVFTSADSDATTLAMTASLAAGAIGPAAFGTNALY